MQDMPRTLVATAVLLGVLAGAAGAVPAGQPASLDALALCRAAERLEGAARRQSLERGLALARAALAADDRRRRGALRRRSARSDASCSSGGSIRGVPSRRSARSTSWRPRFASRPRIRT
jgi:hypothetical protein